MEHTITDTKKGEDIETSYSGDNFSESGDSFQKERNPWLACFLTLCVIGLGQVYNGEFGQGIKYYLGSLGVGLLTAFLILFLPVPINLLALVLGFIYLIYAIIVSWKAARGKGRYYRLKPYNKSYIYIVLILCSWYLINPLFSQFTKSNIVHAYRVVATSMLPTILDGDHILVDELSYKFYKPRRHDVVVFKYPKDETQYFIKRVIGLPGEMIQIQEKQCFINGRPFHEQYIIHSGNSAINYPELDNFGPFKVPAGSFFVMGDNRDWSMDSRTFGSVNHKKIVGRAFMVYWPGSINGQRFWDRIGKKIY